MSHETYHSLSPNDQDAMKAMRGAIGVAKPVFGPELRPIFDEMMEHTPDAPEVVYSESKVGNVAGWWCRPKQAKDDQAILYLHGGAYVVGSARADRHLAGQFAFRCEAAAFLPDYRLAPEHPFPAALEDAAAAYRGLESEGYKRIAIVGDSAGGGLALAILALMVAEGRSPVGAATISPWTDLALEGESMVSRAEADPLLSRETLAGAVLQYLGGNDPKDARVSPLYGDQHGLPPVRLHVGEDEVLLDDSRRYAERIKAAGGICDVHIWAGMTHVFPSSVGMLEASGKALDDMGDFLRRVFLESTEVGA